LLWEKSREISGITYYNLENKLEMVQNLYELNKEFISIKTHAKHQSDLEFRQIRFKERENEYLATFLESQDDAPGIAWCTLLPSLLNHT
jgi:hypothetical protein